MGTPPETACACVAGGRTAHSPASQLGDRANGPVPQVAVTCSAAARRVPADLRTRSVANPAGHQRFMDSSCRATRVHEAPLLCAVRKAGRAAPDAQPQRMVIAVHRDIPRSERMAEACGDTWCSRSVWRYAVHRCMPETGACGRDVWRYVAQSQRVALRRAPRHTEIRACAEAYVDTRRNRSAW
jgi:hypothetical protein